MSLIQDTTEETTPFVRTDLSIGIIVTLLVAAVVAYYHHWTLFIIALAFSYMASGISALHEWNKQLQDERSAPSHLFSFVRTAAILPAILLLVSFHYQGHPPWMSGVVALGVLLVYLFVIYAVAFRGIPSEEVYFEDDPYTGEAKVWCEDEYIPRLEAWAVEQDPEE